ncbi:F-box protein At5g07610-like [Papaver somniferum]|uniref:F-box protein At5g07610-like n=1 Tax=Papaver somniferum TaxID=3469 RepID=UPI000E6FA710|nr:F-box protein At5g07610-like [Papaver somniferum]
MGGDSVSVSGKRTPFRFFLSKMLSVSSNNKNSKMISVSVSSNNQSLSSASTIGGNSDVLINILYLLPLKSLCAFKTVSIQWHSLISDPYFERNYNRQSCRLRMPALFINRVSMEPEFVTDLEPKTLVMDEQNGFDYVPFDIPLPANLTCRINFEHACSGLVLCKFVDHRPRTTYVIYNPSMRCCKTLPSAPFRNTRVPIILSVTIAFDPAKSSYYQVVSVCNENISKGLFHIEIYSSETDSWRDAGDPFPFSSPGRLALSGVYWNGSVHWIDQWSATLHYFDIDCELMKTVAIPTQPRSVGDDNWQVEYFNECRGHFHLMEMRMDYTGWDAKYCFDLSSLTTVYPSILQRRYYHYFGLDVLLIEEGEDSSRLILRIAKEKVISFDLKNKSFKEMYDVRPGFCVKGFQYIETLAHV